MSKKDKQGMTVKIKDFSVSMELGNNGIEFGVYDGGEHLGDFILNRAFLQWNEGRATKGKRLSLKKIAAHITEKGKKVR